jgi:hypothetical protein
MGHSSIRVTLDLYGHLYPDANRTVLSTLDELTRTGVARHADRSPLTAHRSRNRSLAREELLEPAGVDAVDVRTGMPASLDDAVAIPDE